MLPGKEPSIIITLGYRNYDTFQMQKYSLYDILRSTSIDNELGADVIWATTRYGARVCLDQYASPTKNMVRVNTGETVNVETGGDPRPFVFWPRYKPGRVGVFVCSSVTVEDTVKCISNTLFDGDSFARDMLWGAPKVIMHYQDEHLGNADMPPEKFMKQDFVYNMVLHLPRDIRTEKSIEASAVATGALVKDLWEMGLGIPYDSYMDIATTAFRSQIA